MSDMNFDDYENLFNNINTDSQQQQQQQQRERTHLFLQQQQQLKQQQLMQQAQQAQQVQQAQQSQKDFQASASNQKTESITNNFPSSVFSSSYDNGLNNQRNPVQQEQRPIFDSYNSSSSHFDSEVNFNDLNDAVSSINSGILSPYSTGSSPDDFFLSATNSNVDSQYSQDGNDFNVDLNNTHNLNNDILYPQPLVPVPMAESASNSTVTFNTHDNYHNAQQNMATLNTVEEADEDIVKKESPASNSVENSANQSPLMKQGRKVKSSHNLIEKKYRTNINSKIIELRNCVPALRILVAKNGNHRTRSTGKEVEETDDYYEGDGYSDDEEKLDGLKPAKKLNKATILSKASEYIRHLEKKNEILREQNYQLRKIINSSGIRSDSLFNQQQVYQDPSLQSSPFNNSSSTGNGSNLVSPADPNFQQLNTSHMQGQMQNQMQSQLQNNPITNQNHLNVNPNLNSNPNTNQVLPDHQSLTSKLLMGGISCVLGASSLDDFSSTSAVDQKGLFALPVLSFGSASHMSNSPSKLSLIFSGIIKLSLCFYLFYCYVFPSIFVTYRRCKKNLQDENINFYDSLVHFFFMLASPSKFTEHSFNISNIESEVNLIGSLARDNLDRSFISAAIKTLLSPDNPENSFLKALYLKRISEWLNSQHAYPFKSILSSLTVKKAGSKYWSKAHDFLDNNGLTEYTYKNFEEIELKKAFDDANRIKDIKRLVNVLKFSLIKELLRTLMEKFVQLEALRMTYMHLGDSEKSKGRFVLEQCDALLYCMNGILDKIRSFPELLDDEIVLKVNLIKFFMDSNSEVLLSNCVASYSNFPLHERSRDIQVGMLCAVLKYELSTMSNHKKIYKLLSKLKSANLQHQNHLSSFQFISLLNIFEVLTLDILDSLNEYVFDCNNSLQKKIHDNQNQFDDNNDSRNVELLSKVNILLINILGLMRIHLGEIRVSDEMEVSSELKDYLVDGLVKSMNEINEV